jgi:serine/threonine protein kinase
VANQIIAGKYELIRELGSGGMGVVHEGMHIGLNRRIAIKTLHPQFTGDPAFLKRFKREARTMARLDHPNIIRVFDARTLVTEVRRLLSENGPAQQEQEGEDTTVVVAKTQPISTRKFL